MSGERKTTRAGGVVYEVIHDREAGTTTLRPIGQVPIAEDRVLNVTTGRTSCCGAFTTIGQDDGVEYCRACGCDLTGYTADDADDLTAPTRHTVRLP
jgi:hypothetical protein